VAYTVGDVATLAHVSVRTLHHYDEVGLLAPSERSEAGYRLYTDGDLERLQQVLLYKELGFALDEIREIMADPAFDRRDALIAQRDLIAGRAKRLEAVLDLIDHALVSLEGGFNMSKEEMFEVFGDFDPSEYEEEVQERWGETDAYKESARRTKRYTKADWQKIKDEGAANMDAMVVLFDEGVEPTDPRAMDVAEDARLQIDRWFYPLSHEMHVSLGEMYIADPRFTTHYDDHREGLALWFRDAIKANAARAGV
jgi:DNA-binding transcriptional MerR regulator